MNSRFPSPPFFRKHFKSSSRLRVGLVLALIALVSTLPFYSFAQGDPIPVKKSRAYKMAPDKGSFILYAGPSGETLCRLASPDEAQSMRNGSRDGLTQINHLEKGLTAESANAGLTIILRATDQLNAPENAQAKQAFIAAAAKWETLIQDPITIAVDVDYGTTFFGDPFSGPNVIGATESPQYFIENNYPDIRARLVSHAPVGSAERTLANALPATTVPTDIGNIDTVLVTSPFCALWGHWAQVMKTTRHRLRHRELVSTRHSDSTSIPAMASTPNDTDFDAVAVHEIGHLLGFSSQVGDQELNPGSSPGITIWDLFRFRPATANLGNFATAQRILSSGGTQVQFSGGAGARPFNRQTRWYRWGRRASFSLEGRSFRLRLTLASWIPPSRMANAK